MPCPPSTLQHFSLIVQSSRAILSILSRIYTEENFWRGLDKSGTRTKKSSTDYSFTRSFFYRVNDVKGKRLNFSASVLDSCLVRMLLPL